MEITTVELTPADIKIGDLVLSLRVDYPGEIGKVDAIREEDPSCPEISVIWLRDGSISYKFARNLTILPTPTLIQKEAILRIYGFKLPS